MFSHAKLPLALVIIGILGLAWCISDPYRRRAALFTMVKVTSRNEVEWSPLEAPAWYVVDPPRVLEPYEPLARQVIGKDDGGENRASRLLKYVAELGGNYTEISESEVTGSDDISRIMEDVRTERYRGNCAHYSFILQTLAQAGGLHARVVGLDGEVWINGDGHALNEVYLPERKSWAVFDPLYHAYFVDQKGKPLSLLDLRNRFLEGSESEVRVVQGEIRAHPDGAEQVLSYYGRHIMRVKYQGSLNLLESRYRIYEGSLGKTIRLASWPRQIRRAMENAVWKKDRLYYYVDRAEVDDAFLPYYVARGAGVLSLAGMVWLATLAIHHQRGRNRTKPTPL